LKRYFLDGLACGEKLLEYAFLDDVHSLGRYGFHVELIEPARGLPLNVLWWGRQ